METEGTVETGRSGIGVRVLDGVETGLALVRRLALIAVLVLSSVWFAGRAVEAVHGRTVFDLHLIYWLGVSIWIAVAVYLIGAAAAYMGNIREYQNKLSLLIPWTFFLILVAVILFGVQGFRISSMGLFATAAGSNEPARQASFLLFKYHPLNPLLPFNLITAKASGMPLDINAMSSFIWNWNYVLLFFIWSVGYGIVLLLGKIEQGPKIIHLFFAVSGLMTLIIMKSLFPPTKVQMIWLHAAALALFIFQVLLTYSCLRLRAARKNADAPAPGHFRLPPSAVKFALIIFLMAPVLGDLQNQFALVHPSNKIIKAISRSEAGTVAKAVAATSISIHSGPAYGDDIVGILPGGVHVPVLEKKNNWVKIGKHRWIADKFLTPLRKG